ncbi:unnamed protein product [Urochloa decumbens]|uniref:Wall-associated receptor kinase galacturonan-binding domain-containing protein n=1 Tax=Urochloa decumbens TaxID=240449 RepID=A0ABC8Z602_9POAL
MAVFLHLRLPLPLLLALLVAALRGVPCSGDSYNSSMCLKPQLCGGVSISYPFYLSDETGVLLGNDSSYCGYPGLGIKCDGGNQAVLELVGEKYIISSINYTGGLAAVTVVDKEVLDEEACLRVDHNVTLPPGFTIPNTSVVDYIDFFLDCYFGPEFIGQRPDDSSAITCSNFIGPKLSFVFLSENVPFRDTNWWQGRCQEVFQVPVLKGSLGQGDPQDDPGWMKAMALALRLPLPLLLAILVAACRGDGDSYNTSICELQASSCGKVKIKYPFYLSNETAEVRGIRNSYCGYPGLAIDCDDGENPVMHLDNRDYNVMDINYSSSTISLAYPDVIEDESCSGVNYNVTVPPALWLYVPGSTIIYLLFSNCSISQFPGQSRIEPLNCASSDGGGQYSFFIPSDMPHEALSRACKQAFLVPVLRSASQIDQTSPQWTIGGVLNQGFQLTWDVTRRSNNCTKCDNSNGRCAYNRDGEFVGCLCTDGRVDDQECSNGESFLFASTFLSLSPFEISNSFAVSLLDG